MPKPTVTSIAPTTGSALGGTLVQIGGANFTPTSTVAFGLAAAQNVWYTSATQLTAQTPGHAAGSVDIQVTNADGTSDLVQADAFFFLPPSVTTLTPKKGSTRGGTTVSITGTNLLGATKVLFGTTEASFTPPTTQTQITAVTPAHAAGTVDVVITNPQASSGLVQADQFFFEAAIPKVTGLSIHQGAPAGGTPVQISGSGFLDANAVLFGNTPVDPSTIDIRSDNQINTISPAHAAGTVEVLVTNPDGTSAPNPSASTFNYVAAPAPPTVSPEDRSY